MSDLSQKERMSQQTEVLFNAILKLETIEECTKFFEDLCTMKELADMAQRVETANMLLAGKTYEQIVKEVEISTATISRINRCIQYGNGGYRMILGRLKDGKSWDVLLQNILQSVCLCFILWIYNNLLRN